MRTRSLPYRACSIFAFEERALMRTALQEVLEAEMTEALGAEKGERAEVRFAADSSLEQRRFELSVPP
jgi:transposase-like protein